MKIQPINSIECALLHNRYSPMAEAKLFSIIESLAKSVGWTGECHDASPADSGLTIINVGEYQISVSQVLQALPKKGFGGCLPQPITVLMMPDAEARIDKHVAHSFISIARQMPTLDERLDIDITTSDPLDFFLSEDTVAAMTLGYKLADALHRNNPATAIHWLPSDHLVSPQMFELAAVGSSLTPFFVRPYLYSSAGAIGSGNPVGMVGNGSQYLIGKPVIFEEAIVDYQWMIKRVSQFIDHSLAKGQVPSSGTNFCVQKDEIIEVLHKDPEPINPIGSFSLVARNVPQFGISGGLHSMIQVKAIDQSELENTAKLDKNSTKLDENDPIDLAIMNALRARKEADEVEAATKLPAVKDRRMGPRKTHEVASFGRRPAFGKR